MGWRVAGGWGAAWDTTSEDGVCSRLVHMSGNDEGGEWCSFRQGQGELLSIAPWRHVMNFSTHASCRSQTVLPWFKEAVPALNMIYIYRWSNGEENCVRILLAACQAKKNNGNTISLWRNRQRLPRENTGWLWWCGMKFKIASYQWGSGLNRTPRYSNQRKALRIKQTQKHNNKFLWFFLWI